MTDPRFVEAAIELADRIADGVETAQELRERGKRKAAAGDLDDNLDRLADVLT